MKKLTSILLAILLLAGCSAGEKQEKSAYDHGLELVTMLDEMSESEEYIQIYTGASSINEIVAGIGELDYSAPSNVYKITVSEENLSAMAELGRLEGASEELQSFVKQRTLAALITQVNAMAGAETLAATSVCTAGKTFVNKELESAMIYLYVYKEAPPIAVTFVPGDDSTVSATANFILYKEFTCGSSAELKEFFSELAPEVTQVVGG